MNKVIVRAPVRADLAGGTLDLWPIYLFHPGARTVNVAISFYAESEVHATDDGAIEIHLTDQQYRQRYESLQAMSTDPRAALLHRALEHFKLNGVRITTRTDAPRGSGLGGSSALSITLVRALSEISGEPVEGEDLIALVRDLETRLLGVPAGVQDYYPPVFGGLASLHLNPGRITRHPLSSTTQDLAAHMLLHYTGVSHFSGTNNWELYKRQIEGKKKVQKGLRSISETALEMERALEAGNYEAAGAALQAEWEHRKAMIDGISTPEIDAAIDAAREAGAWGGKVCGAGGGGCIVFLFPPDRRDAVKRALSTVPGRVLDAAPVANGMIISREGEAAPPTTAGHRPRSLSRGEGESLEQLYVYGGTGEYRPFVLAEGIITHAESRSGTHHQVTRTFLAPIAVNDGRVHWHQASLIDPEELDIRAVPESGRATVRVDASPEALMQNAMRGQEAFRSFLEQGQRLQIFHNPAFGFYSEPAETREAFTERCMEEATRQVEEAQERLESTFRRRIDQLRERSQREEREMEKSEEHAHLDNQELNVAWGQTLYNITSGRKPAAADPSQSVRETDYMDNIAQIQKAWDRELEGLREELNSKARSIEEISIAPTARNIEITKYLILWAPPR
jgi:D-glycero-alpha-D-manno-heptose-7-phosphate kinase